MSRGPRRMLFAFALVAACAFAVPATASALTRATTDRPDDTSVSEQVHAVYAIPSDAPDRALDTNGDIEDSVDSWQAWLRGEAGNRGLRLDTSGGDLDVTFVQLSQTNATLQANGVFVRNAIEAELSSRGLISANKIYAVYYDGTNSSGTCASGAYPPTVPGQVGALYLDPQHPANTCDTGFGSPGAGYADFAILHEMFHVMGFVPSCAPHHAGPPAGAGHVNDTNDLMFSGIGGIWSLPPVLDVGHDDYFSTGSSSCPDFANSFYREGNVRPPASTGTTSTAAAPKKCKKGQKLKRGKCKKKKKKKK